MMENNELPGIGPREFSVNVEEMLSEMHKQDVEKWHSHLVDFADGLLAENKYLEALILSFYKELEKADCSTNGGVEIDGKQIQSYYAEYFGITKQRHGEKEI